jgi:hypothetical protein
MGTAEMPSDVLISSDRPCIRLATNKILSTSPY